MVIYIAGSIHVWLTTKFCDESFKYNVSMGDTLGEREHLAGATSPLTYLLWRIA